MARPTHSPTAETRKLVKQLASVGVREASIATIVEVDPKTLRKHYRRELDVGHIEANAKVAANLFNLATGSKQGAVTAAIFWLKTREGWKEPAQDLNLALSHEDALRELEKGA